MKNGVIQLRVHACHLLVESKRIWWARVHLVVQTIINGKSFGKWWLQIRPTFMWRACQGILSTNTPLYAMKIGSRIECEVCFDDTKSIIKILMYI